MHTFNVGDLVRHTAGTTKMAIAEVLKPSGDLMCQWQDRDGKPHSEPYPPHCLQLWSEYEAEKAANRERINRQVEAQQSHALRARRGR